MPAELACPFGLASSLPAKNLIPPSLPHPKFGFGQEVVVPFRTEDGNWRMDKGIVFAIAYTPDECLNEGPAWYYLLRWSHIPGIPEYTGRESDYCREDSLLAFVAEEAT
jgi:hypothetical protein